MAASPDREPLTGLARSLVDLFDRAAREEDGGPPESLAGEGAAGDPIQVDIDDPVAVARELDHQVDEFLAEPGRARRGPGSRIRALASALVEAGRVEPVADAVVRLTMVPAKHPGHRDARALGRDLVTPAVAARLAARIGAVRDGSRRAVLTRALGGLGPTMARAAGEALKRTESRSARRALTEVLAAVGEEGAEVLGSMVRDERWFVVRNAVLVLGETRAPWAVRHLTGALEHPDPRVRREALMALARVGGREAGRGVTERLGDPEARVREAAALAAGALRERGAVGALVKLVQAGDEDPVMVAAMRALGRIGDPVATEELARRANVSLVSRASAEVRIAAYRALAALGTPRARTAVRSGLRDRDDEVREAVEELVRASGRRTDREQDEPPGPS